MEGNLTIKLVEGDFIRDHAAIGKMSTWCVILCGTQKGQSEICLHGGKKPRWNELITFNVKDEQTVHFHVYSRGIMKDYNLGFAEIIIPQLKLQGTLTGWLDVLKKGVKTGRLYVEAQWQNNRNQQPKPNVMSSSMTPSIPSAFPQMRVSGSIGAQPNIAPIGNSNLPQTIGHTNNVPQNTGYSCGWTSEMKNQPLFSSQPMNIQPMEPVEQPNVSKGPVTIVQGNYIPGGSSAPFK